MEIRIYKKASALFLSLLFCLSSYGKAHGFELAFRQFSKQVCRPGTEGRYQRYLESYKEQGLYIPETSDGKADLETIAWYSSELKNKELWIQKIIQVLQKKKSFKQEKLLLREVENSLDRLVHYRSERMKNSVTSYSKDEEQFYKILRGNFNKLSHQIVFLQGYLFPVDHLKDRENYESLKLSSHPKDKLKQNRLYLKRKLVEDGTSIEVSYYGDALLRTLLSSLYLRINSKNQLTEDLRYDLKSFLGSLESEFLRGKQYHIRKNKKWLSRVQSLKNDYNQARQGYVLEKGKKVELSKYLETKKVRENKLKEFVLSKQKESYEYWLKQPKSYQRLYTLLTILYNEVGRIEKKSSVERTDIVKLVQHRYYGKRYSRIPASHERSDFFHQKGRRRWLDVLFKEGEFSFTYFYMPSVVKTFCPDMSRAGKKLRLENWKIISKIKNQDTGDDEAVRYFSRISMIGRIDMSKIWRGFRPIDHFKGQRVRGPASLLGKVNQDQFTIFKKFKEDGESLSLIEVNNRSYVMRQKDKALFQYRDPAIFRFFRAF